MRNFFLLAAAIAGSGCATAVTRYTVSAEDEPYSYYENGVPFIISEGESSSIVFGPAARAQNADDRQLFFLEVANVGESRFNLGPDSITVTTDSGKSVPVLTPERLQREANREANWLKFSSAMQQISNSAAASNAGYSSGSASYAGRSSYYGAGSYASATTYGTASYSGYNGGAAAQGHFAAQAENRAVRAEYTAKISELLRTAQDGALETFTIRPKSKVTSLVLIERIPDDARTIRVDARIAGERHTMSWNYSVE